MWQLLILGMLLQQPATVGPVAETETAEVGPRYDVGETHIMILAFLEQRYLFFENFLDRLPSSGLRIQYRLQGEDVVNLVQVGELVIDEAVDDTGKSMVDPSTITDERRNAVRDVNMKPEDLRARGWMFGGSLEAADRAATVIKHVKGSMRCVFAAESEEIVIPHALEYLNKKLDDPRLAELGIEIKLIPSRDPAGDPEQQREIGVMLTSGESKLRNVEFCDAWLRPIALRAPIDAKTKDNETYKAYQTGMNPITNDSTLILSVSPEVSDRRVELNLTDVKLP